MLQPKRRKFNKAQKGKVKGIAIRGTTLIYGKYGLISLEPARIGAKEIESARITINRKIKKIGKMWIRIFPNIPVTKKPTEVRMGQGKGAIDRWIARVKTNTILIELSESIPPQIAKIALKAAGYKFRVLTKIIYRPIIRPEIVT